MPKTILISKENLAGAFNYITKGWCNAFNKIGCETIMWDGFAESLGNKKIDMFLGCSGHKQVFPQDLRDRYNTKIGIHVNPFGDRITTRSGWPNLNEPRMTVNWVNQQKPDFVFYYGLAEHKQYWSNWEFELIPMPTAGDSIKYYPDSQQTHDIGYVGMRWSYKSINIDKWLIPALLKHSAVVHGTGAGNWDSIGSKFKGAIGLEDERDFIAKCKITPCVVEPHTTEYGIDIPERMYKAPLCGSMVVCDLVHTLDKYINIGDFNMCQSPRDYLKAIEYYLNNHEERKTKLHKQQTEILRKHTYFSRIKSLLEAVGFTEEAAKAQAEVDKQTRHHSHGERWI